MRHDGAHQPDYSAILVLAVLGACNSAPGDGTDDPIPPSAPTILSITPGPGYVDIAWQHNGDGASAYVVYRAEAGDGDASPGALQDVNAAKQANGSSARYACCNSMPSNSGANTMATGPVINSRTRTLVLPRDRACY